jgi:hypothetical protein
MRHLIAITTASLLLAISVPVLDAQDRPKINALPPAVEAQWVKNVKNHKTQDGATVWEVMTYVQKMRPKEFKIGTFEVCYDYTGKPVTVCIGYWIGAKRLDGDSFVDLGYDMTPDGKVKPVPSNEQTATALEGGRDTFLQYIDEDYKDTCHPDPDEQPDC